MGGNFLAPTLEYSLLSPVLIVLGGAILGVLIEAFAPRASRSSSQLFITLTTLATALTALIRNRNGESVTVAMNSMVFDGAGVLLQGSILVIAIISVFLLA
ncbi:MAG: hypothetical protein RL313_713, partial [Actinomycetota bacterium]